ncbi:MAG: hypothetical protein SF339_02075 [Blastocatellia bacterium]|nr:hypothetical protein [Blastocatellia bacterium]
MAKVDVTAQALRVFPREEGVMLDLIYVGVAVIFFLLSAAYVRGCERL